jgi:hypothetical protein
LFLDVFAAQHGIFRHASRVAANKNWAPSPSIHFRFGGVFEHLVLDKFYALDRATRRVGCVKGRRG